MLEKREVRFFPGKREALWTEAWDWWSRQGFQLTKTGPYRFHGSSFYSRIGLRRECDVILDEAPGGTNVDLAFRAQITDAGLVAGAVTAVLLLPVAVVGGAISYTEYESDARNFMLAFWHFLGAATSGAGLQAPAMPTPCPGCSAAMLPDWKLCPYCGRPRGSAA